MLIHYVLTGGHSLRIPRQNCTWSGRCSVRLGQWVAIKGNEWVKCLEDLGSLSGWLAHKDLHAFHSPFWISPSLEIPMPVLPGGVWGCAKSRKAAEFESRIPDTGSLTNQRCWRRQGDAWSFVQSLLRRVGCVRWRQQVSQSLSGLLHRTIVNDQRYMI